MNLKLAVLVGLVLALVGSALVPVGAFASDTIYWGNDENDTISFAPTQGGPGGDLKTEGATIVLPSGLALDPAAGRIYWSNFGGGLLGAGISSASLDGTGGEDVKIGEASAVVPSGLA